MSEVVLGDVIDEKDCCTIPVVTLDDGFEAFLTRSIPNGHLDIEVVVYFYHLRSEFHSCVRGKVPTVTIY
jgi:hypothetical protein